MKWIFFFLICSFLSAERDEYLEEYSSESLEGTDLFQEAVQTLQSKVDLETFLSPNNPFGGGVLGLFSTSARDSFIGFQKVAQLLHGDGFRFAESHSQEILDLYRVSPGRWKVFVHPCPRFVDFVSNEKGKLRFGGQDISTSRGQEALQSFIFQTYLPSVSRLASVNEYTFMARNLPVFLLLLKQQDDADVTYWIHMLRQLSNQYRDRITFGWMDPNDAQATENFALERFENGQDIVALVKEGEEYFVLYDESDKLQGRKVEAFISSYVDGGLLPVPLKAIIQAKNPNLEL